MRKNYMFVILRYKHFFPLSNVPIMKKQLLLLLFCISSMALSAQITESEKSMSQGVKNALTLEIPDVSEKFVEKVWKKYIKDFEGKNKTKRDKKADEWMTDDAEIVSIGAANTVDVFARISENGNDVYLTMWTDLGGAFVSSTTHPAQYTEAEKFLMRFALLVAKESTELELEAEEKRMKKMEAELKKLERDNDRYHREIETAKERIAKAEANIEENVKAQEDSRTQIELQTEKIKEVQKRLSELN